MPKGMRGDDDRIDARHFRVFLHAQEKALTGDGPSLPREEHLFLAMALVLDAEDIDITGQPRKGELRDRDDARLAPFAGYDADQAMVAVDVGQAEGAKLGYA